MLVDFPLLETGKRYRVLRGFQDDDGQHLIAGMEPLILGLEYNREEERLALICQTSVHIAHRFFFAVATAKLDAALGRLAVHFEAVDTHVRDPLLASAAAIAALAEQHHDGDPSLARSAYRLAIARYTHLEQTAPNPGSAAAARQTAELLAKRLATVAETAT